MHPGSERHWLTYLAEPGPSVLRHLYGGRVSSSPTETFAWQETGENESSICIHTQNSTATELGASQRDVTEGRSLPASRAGSSHAMPCAGDQTSDTGLGSSLKANLPKLHESQSTEVTHKSCANGQRQPYKPNCNLRARHLLQEQIPAPSRNSCSTERPRKAGRFSTFRHSLVFLSYS